MRPRRGLRREIRQKDVETGTVEAHAIDEGRMTCEPKQAWFRVARLRLRRHRAEFDEAETEIV